MPIYEYRCQACQHEFEALQKISDPALTDCPECHAPSLRKKVSAAGFRLSGSGWYETDFKNNGNKKNLADKGGAASDGAAPGGDAKPASDKPADKPAADKKKDTGSSGASPAPSA